MIDPMVKDLVGRIDAERVSEARVMVSVPSRKEFLEGSLSALDWVCKMVDYLMPRYHVAEVERGASGALRLHEAILLATNGAPLRDRKVYIVVADE